MHEEARKRPSLLRFRQINNEIRQLLQAIATAVFCARKDGRFLCQEICTHPVPTRRQKQPPAGLVCPGRFEPLASGQQAFTDPI
jgi:hypothetical protein